MTTQNMKDNMWESSLNTLLKGVNHNTGKPFTHRETANILNNISEYSPNILRDKIKELKDTIELLESYLPIKGK